MPDETTPPLETQAPERTFNPGELYELASKAELSERQARAYQNRFSVGDIIHLACSGISARKAAAYPERLTAREIAELVENKIPPETVLQYPVSPVHRLVAFVRGKIGAEIAGEYPERFAAPGGDATAVRWWDDGVAVLAQNGIEPRVAASYPERFSAHDIVTLCRAKIRPEEAASYPPHINHDGICALVEKGISGQEATAYTPRFFGKDMLAFNENGVTAEEARAYLEFVPAGTIIGLHKKEITPETANRYIEASKDIAMFYGEIFTDLIEQCLKHNVSPETMAMYLKNHGGCHGALALVKADITPDVAVLYQGFDGRDIAHLVKANVPSDIAQKFPPSLDGETITLCYKNGVMPGEVDDVFFTRFDNNGIKSLLKANVSIAQALAYPDRFSGQQIARFIGIGLGPDDADAADFRD